jgi:hypothetical protein
LMSDSEVYDEEEDLTQDPVDMLASDTGFDLLDFCIHQLEVEIEGREAEGVLDEEELKVSLCSSQLSTTYHCSRYSLLNGRQKN